MIERFLNWRERQQDAGRALTAENLARAEAQKISYAENGMSPEEMRSALMNYALAAVPWGLAARPLAPAARAVGNFFAPRQVGVHHTLYGKGLDAPLYPAWNTPTVRPSTTLGTTAGDQIPGMSYMWSARGAGGARAAADQARGQTSLMFQNQMLEPATQGVGKVVTTPRFAPRPDPNLPGTRAAMVQGPQLRVAGEVASPAGPLSAQNATSIASMANRQKLIEAGKSVGKIGTAVAGGGAANRNIDMAALRQMLR